MRQENAPPVRGQKRSQNLLWQDEEKTSENARTVAGRGVISRVTSRTEPPFGAMSMGEPIQPRYRRVYHHHGRFVYFFCPSHQLKNRDSLLPRSSLFFCVFFQQRSRPPIRLVTSAQPTVWLCNRLIPTQPTASRLK